jgi:SNARE protein
MNTCIVWICRYASENKRVDLFDGPSVEDGFAEENGLLASSKLQYYRPCERNNVALVNKMSVSIKKVTVL